MTNAEIAIRQLMNGDQVRHNDDIYVMSENFQVCKLIRNPSNMYELQDNGMSVGEFIQMCADIPREQLLLSM